MPAADDAASARLSQPGCMKKIPGKIDVSDG
jgi:hypothetical protein